MSHLSQALEFSDRDLRTNRNGHITSPQRSKLRRQRMLATVSQAFLILMFLVGLVGLIVPSLQDIISNRYPLTATSLFSTIFGGGGLSFATLWLIILLIRTWNQFDLDIREGRALAIYGNVLVGGGFPLSRNIRYSLWIENLRFDISRQALDAIVSGETYQVYYTPRTKVLLSLEEYKRKRQ